MEFKKCNITKARNLYNKGITIYLVPSKVYPDFKAIWVKPYGITFSYKNEDFDTTVNSFSYYNCNGDLGKKVHFYTYE